METRIICRLKRFLIIKLPQTCFTGMSKMNFGCFTQFFEILSRSEPKYFALSMRLRHGFSKR